MLLLIETGFFYYREAKSPKMNDFNAQKELRDAPEDFTVVGTTKDGVPGFLESAPGNLLNLALGNVELSSDVFCVISVIIM